jgi:hypothetical protein
MNDDDILTSEEASEFLATLGMSHGVPTLAKLRCTGGGPLFLRCGRSIRYRRRRLREYANSRTVELTSTSAQPLEAAKGTVVVDIDCKPGGANGLDSLEEHHACGSRSRSPAP